MAENVWLQQETGLPDDFELVIERSYFGTDARYQGGERLLLIWEGTSPDPEIGEQNCWFGCGAGWATNDQKIAFHERRKKAQFNQNTPYRRMINKVINMKDENGQYVYAPDRPCRGHEEVMRILTERDSENGAKNAEVWLGMKFRMKRERVDYGPGIEPRDVLLPVEFLGLATQGAAPAASIGKTETATVNKVLQAKLIGLARKSENHDEFQEAAVEIEGVVEDSDLLNDVMDSDGFYARYKK